MTALALIRWRRKVVVWAYAVSPNVSNTWGVRRGKYANRRGKLQVVVQTQLAGRQTIGDRSRPPGVNLLGLPQHSYNDERFIGAKSMG